MTNEGMTIAKSKDKARESKPINKESGHCNREQKDEIKGMSIKNFIMLFLSGVINAIGVTIFIAPVNLYDSGISGTSILLSQLTPRISVTFRFPDCAERSAVFVRIKTPGGGVYNIRNFCGCDLLNIGVADNRRSSRGCKYRVTACR